METVCTRFFLLYIITLKLKIIISYFLFSQLGNEDNNLSCYELQISAKDYCFGRKNQLIGVAVLPIRDINNTGSFASWFPLGRALFISENGWAILRILSQRSNDELARDFVMLKFDRRVDNDLIDFASSG